MNQPDLIFLVGLPGSGKSSIGKGLSEMLNYDFLDLDYYIVEKEGRSIPEIFSKNGEGYFRELESKYLQNLVDDCKNSTVVATGGGTPCFNDNMSLITTSGFSIFIDVKLDQLIERIGKDEKEVTARPLFAAGDLKEKYNSLLNNRRSYYEQASLTVDATDYDIDEVIRNIVSHLKE
ncbi:shikimate kinase [Marinigracilibium pacificum]|uniref:Shikimate kinase n=1 Tax=Marinigracilibium pacificum TaxID=2729599 RepID=A0A848J2V9_9BACT|nr:shikimate kinase [Marinigracilibium pacificum]NMM48824.1 shikimate kinase [Marinigracilibium pacificum]